MHITNKFSCLKTACFVQLQTSGNKKCSLNYIYFFGHTNTLSLVRGF